MRTCQDCDAARIMQRAFALQNLVQSWQLQAAQLPADAPERGVWLHCAAMLNAGLDGEDSAWARVDQLEAAIKRHKVNTWGAGEVEHPEDLDLYAALEVQE
jgi:hypothetical protein